MLSTSSILLFSSSKWLKKQSFCATQKWDGWALFLLILKSMIFRRSVSYLWPQTVRVFILGMEPLVYAKLLAWAEHLLSLNWCQMKGRSRQCYWGATCEEKCQSGGHFSFTLHIRRTRHLHISFWFSVLDHNLCSLLTCSFWWFCTSKVGIGVDASKKSEIRDWSLFCSVTFFFVPGVHSVQNQWTTWMELLITILCDDPSHFSIGFLDLSGKPCF